MMKIKDWKKLQHFKDRRPPWIKLHREILDDFDINSISSDAFKFLIQLYLLASEDENIEGNLPSVDEIAFKLRLNKNKCLELLKQVDIFLISDQYQNYLPERETETETETEGEKRQKAPAKKRSLTPPPDEFEITPELKTWAVEANIASDLHVETQKFLDYFRGTGGLKRDWTAAWRNWMRRADEFASNNPRAGPPSTKQAQEARERQLEQHAREAGLL